MHVHSEHSHDSQSPISEITNTAANNGVSIVAITDHCDIQYYHEGNMPRRIANAMRDIDAERKNTACKIELLKGIEIGEGLWNEDYVQKILAMHEYDVVLGSVHAVRYKNYIEPFSTIDFSKMSSQDLEGYLHQYFDDLFEMLQKIPCDIMAHLTVPFRYICGKYHLFPDMQKYEAQIHRILQYIINNSIAMEINTSCLESAYDSLLPDEWIIETFKNMGGYLITLGSDAHVPANIGKGFETAIKVLRKYDFKNYYYYRHRKSIPCAI